MVRTIEIDEFLTQAASGGLVVDVRTADEFAAGHIGGAVNMPLFSVEERAEVGTLYVQKSRSAAVERGLEVVGPKLADFVRSARAMGDRTLLIYCARGGMRSGSMAWLLDMAGLRVRVLGGGYKSYRAHLETMLDSVEWNMVLLSGATGSGKSELLTHLKDMGEQVIDLEGLARHKGSAFGGIGQGEQPTTEQFINLLHEQLIEIDPSRRIWCEGESMLIGHVFLPPKFYELMQMAKQVEVVMDVEQRLDRLMVEYGHFQIDMLEASFVKIRKRLGDEQLKMAVDDLRSGDVRSAARRAMAYYDKAYRKSASGLTKTEFTTDNRDMRGSASKLISEVDEKS